MTIVKELRVYRKRIFLCTMIVLLMALSIVLWIYFLDEITLYAEFVDSTISFIAIIVATFSAFLIVIQLYEAKNIQEAEFIVNLNQVFVENCDYAKMYAELEKSDLNGDVPDITRVEISNYLTFFETIYLLLEEKVIKIKMLDDLFAYRFFIAVHNETVQKLKLIDVPNNFRNIFFLEKVWIEYRKENGLVIYKESDSLEKACEKNNKSDEYNSIISIFEKRRRYI